MKIKFSSCQLIFVIIYIRNILEAEVIAHEKVMAYYQFQNKEFAVVQGRKGSASGHNDVKIYIF